MIDSDRARQSSIRFICDNGFTGKTCAYVGFCLFRRGWAGIMAAGHRRVDIEEVSDVTIAKFIDKKILDEGNIQIIGTQLFGLVDEDGRKKIILDFSNVEYLSSAALGKLITLDKKVKKAKGKLKLCSIRPDIYEVFAITRLNQLFDIAETQEAALEGF
ncbi:STAS domain-containing protein [Gimesia sp.]|nr:STAS domain-containing protein [Gimesia sp.]